MTHYKLIEKMIKDYQNEWSEDENIIEEVKAFREGMIFAYKILLIKLKKGEIK